MEELKLKSESFTDSVKAIFTSVASTIQTPIFDKTALTPYAKKCLIGETGFLTLSDLSSFDVMVDHFLNANYYDYPDNLSDIIEHLIDLYEQRERDHDFRLITEFIEMMEVKSILHIE